jgi:hypothetical protein
MNFETPVVASASNVEGNVFVKRNGVEVPLQQDMVLQVGDVLRSTTNSIAVISIPGTQQQIPAFLEISNGGEATLGFDPNLGTAGQVVISSNAGDGLGNVTLVAEFEGENQAAILDGQEPAGEMSALIGAGFLAGGAGLASLPVAGAVGAAALFAGTQDDDDDAPASSMPTPGSQEDPVLPADTAGGLAETVSDLTSNLSELTEPVPVIGTVVDAVGDTLESVLVGDNNGGVAGILDGVADGLGSALNGTPLEPVGNALQMGLNALTGALGDATGQLAALGQGTPLEPLADLVGSLLGAPGPNTTGEVGGVVGTLVNVTDNIAQLLEPVPLLGELTGTLGSLVDSVATGNNDGGLSSVLNGAGEGLLTGLEGTPLAVLGEGADTLLSTLGGALAGVGDAIDSVGGQTPAAPLTDLVSDLLGSQGGNVISPLGEIPLLGSLLDSLTSGLNLGADSLDGIPLLGGILDAGVIGGPEGGLLGGVPVVGDLLSGDIPLSDLLGGAGGGAGGDSLAGIPVLGDLLGGLTSATGSSISTSEAGGGGLLGGLPLLGDLTRNLG